MTCTESVLLRTDLQICGISSVRIRGTRVRPFFNVVLSPHCLTHFNSYSAVLFRICRNSERFSDWHKFHSLASFYTNGNGWRRHGRGGKRHIVTKHRRGYTKVFKYLEIFSSQLCQKGNLVSCTEEEKKVSRELILRKVESYAKSYSKKASTKIYINIHVIDLSVQNGGVHKA